MRRLTATISAIVLTLALILLGTGCALPVAPTKEVTVGTNKFTEHYIIGQMIKQLLEDRGFKVNLVSDISTKTLSYRMAAGSIDISAEYNGTYALVSWAEFIEKHATIHPDHQEIHFVETLSDLAALYQRKIGKIKTCVDFEFSARPDGLPALQEFYDFSIDEAYLITGIPGASPLALEERQCEVAIVFGNDSTVAEHEMMVPPRVTTTSTPLPTTSITNSSSWYVYLDDQAFFPPYDLTPYVRAEVLDKYPEIADILNELVATFPGGGELSTPEVVAESQTVWQALNAKIDINKMEPDEVAREYLVRNGLIKE